MFFLLYSSGFMVCRHGDGLLCPHPSVQAQFPSYYLHEHFNPLGRTFLSGIGKIN